MAFVTIVQKGILNANLRENIKILKAVVIIIIPSILEVLIKDITETDKQINALEWRGLKCEAKKR